MDQLKLLDTAIGLMFAYLVLSIICTAIIETVASFLRLRAINLAEGLVWLLDNTPPRHDAAPWPATAWDRVKRVVGQTLLSPVNVLIMPLLALRFDGRRTLSTDARNLPPTPENVPLDQSLSHQLFKHPLIYRLAPGDKVPGYIDPKLFVTALVDVLRSGAMPSEPPKQIAAQKPGDPPPKPADTPALQVGQAFTDVKAAVERLPEWHPLRTALLPVVARAELEAVDALGKAEASVKAIQAWFDQSMDRVSGWYKERIQRVTLLVAMLVTVALNVDTVAISKELWSNDTLRATFVQAAVEATKKQDFLKSACADKSDESPAKNLECWVTDIRKANAKLGGLPIGWARPVDEKTGEPLPLTLESFIPTWDGLVRFPSVLINVLATHLLGWLLTGFALSLGAPFWFDLLSQFVRLRGTGPKPDDKRAERGAPAPVAPGRSI
ncbi:hypothetical protein [Azospirillum sp. TSO22-1]|uniref:hypothetical protein n=1 Tax=Azospirillum sp. TSO22-1 TaxID=716789 RepID=UPI000D614EAC|nr:hypothetical protein [Azospirillum sp. TSO22-1]PWC53582.1 hypothetical protein TSO221_10100 [Azospirillum sp. TSO22-1]